MEESNTEMEEESREVNLTDQDAAFIMKADGGYEMLLPKQRPDEEASPIALQAVMLALLVSSDDPRVDKLREELFTLFDDIYDASQVTH